MQNEYHVLFLFFVGFVFKWGVDYDLLFFAFFHFLNKDPFCLNTAWLPLLCFPSRWSYLIFFLLCNWSNLDFISMSSPFLRAFPNFHCLCDVIWWVKSKENSWNKSPWLRLRLWVVVDSDETSVNPKSKVRARINTESRQLPAGLWIQDRWSFFRAPLA